MFNLYSQSNKCLSHKHSFFSTKTLLLSVERILPKDRTIVFNHFILMLIMTDDNFKILLNLQWLNVVLYQMHRTLTHTFKKLIMKGNYKTTYVNASRYFYFV